MMIANADRTAGTSDAQQRGGALTPVLWVLVAVCAAGNVVSQFMGLNVLVSIGFGVLTLSGATWLIVNRYRRPARRQNV
jgi:hypothetical protein